jgi:hypothetical protein
LAPRRSRRTAGRRCAARLAGSRGAGRDCSLDRSLDWWGWPRDENGNGDPDLVDVSDGLTLFAFM